MSERGGTSAWRTQTTGMWGQAALACVRRAGTSMPLVLLLVAPAAAAPTEPGYALAKIASPARTSRAGVHLALPASAWPHRGMLVATGNILSPLASWIIVDLERQTIRQATTLLAERDGSVRIETDRTDTLPDDERRAVIAAANEVWSTRDPDSPVPGEVTDAFCNVTLFDGEDVLHEVGSTCPRSRFVEVLEAVAASAEHRATRPEPSPDAR